MASAGELTRMLQVIEAEILPKTREGVAAGNKVGGAKVFSCCSGAESRPRGSGLL